MMRIPAPRVRVITWSKHMRLKRRFEVQLYDGADRNGIDGTNAETPLARFKTRTEAERYAEQVRAFLMPTVCRAAVRSG